MWGRRRLPPARRVLGALGALGLIAAGVVPGSGCGYRLVRYEGGLGDVHSVAITTPRNDSYEPGVEFLVADALRREFLRRGAVELVDEPDAADLVIEGAVLPIATTGRSFSSVVLTLEYELVLSVELEARRASGRVIPIDGYALRASERYLASADVEATRRNRQEALRQVAAVLAGRVFDSLHQGLAP